MGELSTQATVGELVVERPSRSRVFSRLGIDFCCGGKKSLAQVCAEKHLDPADVLSLLTADAASTTRSVWADASLSALVHHIVSTHHTFTKSELPRIGQLIGKVARVHGERHPYMVELLEVYRPFAEDMLDHMRKEEHALFPAIEDVAAGRKIDLSRPISVMSRDHDEAGAALERMRGLTNGYEPPEGACSSFRAALAGLAELEQDLFEHVHLENNILFRRVAERG
jgi:regulator of cell morphogenesis and NO signaling